ncbi:MAG: glycosyltransferase family 4 protein [Crocinitomicaceae bacterium]|nr:glycosyltransferase family 4 protein [Crocinitomicaceae bacterium]
MKIIGIAGAENYLLNALPALQQEGIEIEFLSLTPIKQKGSEKDFVKKLEAAGIKVHQIYYKTIGKKTQKAIRDIIFIGHFDLVHSHLIHADLFMAITRKFSLKKFKLVSTKHGHDENYMNAHGFDPKGKKVLKYHYAAKLAEKEVYRSYAISEGLRKLFIAHKIAKPEQIETIPYGFDFHNEHIKSNPAYRFSEHQLVLVGRFTELKGHIDAIAALKLLLPKLNDIALVFIGSGYYEDEVKEYVKSHELDEFVHFMGYQSNSVEWMASSDVVLIPSKAEGFGMVLLEAYSVKKPVVTYDVPALNEHVIHNKTGLLAEPYRVENLSDQILSLLSNRESGTKMGENGYELLKNNYTLNTMITRTIQFYEKCL